MKRPALLAAFIPFLCTGVPRVDAATTPLPDAATLAEQAAWPMASPHLRLRAWFPERIRRAVPVRAHVEVYYGGAHGSSVRIERVEVRAGERVVARGESDLLLAGDEGLYAEMIRLGQLVPPGESKAYSHRFVPYNAFEAFDVEERDGMLEELQLLGTRASTLTADARPMGLIPLTLPFDRLLRGGLGELTDLEIRVAYTAPNGDAAIATSSRRVRRVADFPRLPLGIGGKGELPMIAVEGEWYTGDLHVHDCKDEAGFFRGCPTCQAESINWGDDNTLDVLKTQYDALGADWFTSTSHSYCLQKEEEYDRVAQNVAELNAQGGVMIFADTELTSSESGERQGCGDLYDLICLLPGGVNHMGAHFISSWFPGGTDLGGGYCYGPIEEILDNIAAIRAGEGFAIMNHPCSNWTLGGSITSNSDAAITGIREGGLTGAEIWNGKKRSGQTGHVRWWVKHLLRGSKIHCFSGSDTHDDAFDFGWTHVYAFPDLSRESVQRSLERGMVYISNYQYLAIGGRVPGSSWVPMGGDVKFPSGIGSQDVLVGIAYEMGDRTADVELYRGRAGDSSEVMIAQFAGVSGDGYLLASDSAPKDRDSYYRAYSIAPGSSPEEGVAYTNAVWFTPVATRGNPR
ncbi:MAG: hypothetical protein CME06_00040 [Gemmatimonadetes bacterium]|nr:hypothetical protein [Gemmatimonadota bacterium]